MSLCNSFMYPFLRYLIWVYRSSKICLISYYNKRDTIRISRLAEKSMPLFKFRISLDFRYIINQNTAVSPSIECDAQTLKSFLTCCVPKLHGNRLTIGKLRMFLCEIRTNCRLCRLWNHLVGKAVKKSRLTNVWFTNYYDFDIGTRRSGCISHYHFV